MAITRLLVLLLARERGGSGDLFRREGDPCVPLKLLGGFLSSSTPSVDSSSMFLKM
jgi:hypothetical protein